MFFARPSAFPDVSVSVPCSRPPVCRPLCVCLFPREALRLPGRLCVLFPACRSGLLRPSVFQGLRPSSGAPFPVVFPPGADGRRRRREGTLWPLPLREKPVVCAGLLPARSERFRALGKSHESLPPAASALFFPAPPSFGPLCSPLWPGKFGAYFPGADASEEKALIPGLLQGRRSDICKSRIGRAFRVPTAPPKRYTFIEACALSASCGGGAFFLPFGQDPLPKLCNFFASTKVYLSKRPNGIFGAFIIPQNPDLSSPNVTNGKIFVMNGKKNFFRPRFQPVFSKNPSFSPPAGQS